MKWLFGRSWDNNELFCDQLWNPYAREMATNDIERRYYFLVEPFFVSLYSAMIPEWGIEFLHHNCLAALCAKPELMQKCGGLKYDTLTVPNLCDGDKSFLPRGFVKSNEKLKRWKNRLPYIVRDRLLREERDQLQEQVRALQNELARERQLRQEAERPRKRTRHAETFVRWQRALTSRP
jgi:hypothetical protein